MMLTPSRSIARLSAAREQARETLLSLRAPGGYWEGELSTSALSTATAVIALAVCASQGSSWSGQCHGLVERGLAWLASHQNPDGGWGDTTRSVSNISTTTLCWAAFGAAAADEPFRSVVSLAERWLVAKAGGLEPERLAAALVERYGKDRTFSVPILTTCALAGRLGKGREAWRHVLPLPFELAALPPQFFATLKLPVVSYALPALIAIGQARHFHRPSKNPLARLVRTLTKVRTLDVLHAIQPANGGFLEATPLTSFVTMSLAASGQVEHPVTRRGLEFLIGSVRPDGSWPIDSNLATWVTTLALTALGRKASARLDPEERRRLRAWLLAQQFQTEHPYTQAAPGGWAWTNLPGGVPDADDTAGALLALRALGPGDGEMCAAVEAGITWLLHLQNRDGGIPTFCRGWGALPFDRSGADLTAHAIRAWLGWRGELPISQQQRVTKAVNRALAYLKNVQRPDGAWTPLWFGNQFEPDEANPTYGTGRVLPALAEAWGCGFADTQSSLKGGAEWLVRTQNADGSWGRNGHQSGTIEESALALEGLAAVRATGHREEADPRVEEALSRGAAWLVERIEAGTWMEAAPIGFYFAKLWYYERLYPIISTVGALEAFDSS